MRYTLDEQIILLKKTRNEKAKERDRLIAQPIKGAARRIKLLVREVSIFNEIIAQAELTNITLKASKQLTTKP